MAAAACEPTTASRYFGRGIRTMQGNRENVPLGTDQTAYLSVEDIRLALQRLHYGALEITIHNGQIVQIERKEKLRASPPLQDR